MTVRNPGYPGDFGLLSIEGGLGAEHAEERYGIIQAGVTVL
ncbi:MAG: hypothetical protein ACLRMW_10235 [[Clostridium] symbiosum]